MKRFWIFLILAVAVAAAAGYYWWSHHQASPTSEYQTAAVTSGNIQDLIPATGTVEPQESVDVGAQVAGLILKFGTDLKGNTVDFNSPVDNTTILAEIDPSLYNAQLQVAKAQLEAATANLEVANATVVQDQAKLVEAKNDWDRAQKLGAGEALAQSEYDGYEATYLTAQAQLGIGQATITQIKANIDQAKANVDDATRNVGYCTIKSTITGVVLDRRVNSGETVVSSLNSPSLFLIAKDLTQIQVWVSVNEADSPKIIQGMPVLFTVDGIDRTFKGTVGKMRMNATMTQNVVTYTVEVNADNKDLALIPYRTANVQFLVNEEDNILLAPNAALRWRPRQSTTPSTGDATTAGTAPAAGTGTATATGTGRGKGSRGTAAAATSGGSGTASKPKSGTIYVLDNGTPRAVKVQTGITDGVNTAIIGGDLKAGDQIILNYNTSGSSSADSGTTNPFAPQILRGGRGGGG